MDVFPSMEPWAQTDDEGGVPKPGTQVSLCENGVDHNVRPQKFLDDSLGVHEHGDLTL